MAEVAKCYRNTLRAVHQGWSRWLQPPLRLVRASENPQLRIHRRVRPLSTGTETHIA